MKLISSYGVKNAQGRQEINKYWEVSNVALAVACFLDPRYKMKVVEFYYNDMSDAYGFVDMYDFKMKDWIRASRKGT